MGLAETYSQKKRLGRRFAEKLDGGRGYVFCAAALCGDQAIVADDAWVLGDVLHAYQRGSVFSVSQCVHDVLPVVGQREAPVRQTGHATAVCALSRE
jgi:hypothetical protein